jgi:hypothetical protein
MAQHRHQFVQHRRQPLASRTVGSTITAFIGSPATVLSVMQLKVADTWAQPLLAGNDPTSPTKRSVFGVPLNSSPAVGDDVIWAVPKAKSFVVMRVPASVVTDSSAYFSSDGRQYEQSPGSRLPGLMRRPWFWIDLAGS